MSLLIQKHLTQLLDVPTVRRGNEVSGLRRLYDHLQRNMSALTALGVKTDSYGAMLSSALLRMLPSELVVDYHRRRAADREGNGLRMRACLISSKLK